MQRALCKRACSPPSCACDPRDGCTIASPAAAAGPKKGTTSCPAPTPARSRQRRSWLARAPSLRGGARARRRARRVRLQQHERHLCRPGRHRSRLGGAVCRRDRATRAAPRRRAAGGREGADPPARPISAAARRAADARLGASWTTSSDVEPWLGPHAGVFLSSLSTSSQLTSLLEKGLLGGSTAEAFPFGAGGAQGAIVMDTSDATKASSFLDAQAGNAGAHATSSYRGTPYQVTLAESRSGWSTALLSSAANQGCAALSTRALGAARCCTPAATPS